MCQGRLFVYKNQQYYYEVSPLIFIYWYSKDLKLKFYCNNCPIKNIYELLFETYEPLFLFLSVIHIVHLISHDPLHPSKTLIPSLSRPF